MFLDTLCICFIYSYIYSSYIYRWSWTESSLQNWLVPILDWFIFLQKCIWISSKPNQLARTEMNQFLSDSSPNQVDSDLGKRNWGVSGVKSEPIHSTLNPESKNQKCQVFLVREPREEWSGILYFQHWPLIFPLHFPRSMSSAHSDGGGPKSALVSRWKSSRRGSSSCNCTVSGHEAWNQSSMADHISTC